jgi:hypothetical protein
MGKITSTFDSEEGLDLALSVHKMIQQNELLKQYLNEAINVINSLSKSDIDRENTLNMWKSAIAK